MTQSSNIDTNSRLLHKAVEMADGWSIVHIYDGEDWAQLFEDTTGVPSQQILIQEPTKFQGSLDALAAQLIRQHLKNLIATVYTAWHRDTMKTIRWLVDNT